MKTKFLSELEAKLVEIGFRSGFLTALEMAADNSILIPRELWKESLEEGIKKTKKEWNIK